jgi:hypothetical protein
MIEKISVTLITLLLICSSCSRKSKPEMNSDGINPELPRFIKTLTDKDTLALNTDTLLYYQKSACFGFCPTYNYTIYQTGMIKYEGIQHVDVIGTQYGLITDTWWKEVLTQIQQIHFFELANVYPLDEKMYIPDLPNTLIVVKEFGKRKAIIDNHNAPKELKEFEALLEQKFKQLKLGK